MLITQGSVVRVHSGPLRRSDWKKATKMNVTGDGEVQAEASKPGDGVSNAGVEKYR